MSWTITGSEKITTDPFRSQVSLLLHGNGTNGSTTITDSSPSPKTVTAVGNAQISTAQSKFGGASIAFDGNSDYVAVNAPATATGDLTLEGWIYFTSVAGGSYFFDCRQSPAATSPNNPLIVVDGSPLTVKFALGSTRIIHQTTVSLLTWHHMAVVRASGITKLFLNGVVSDTSYADATPWILGTSSSPIFGTRASLNNLYSLNGFIDEVRFTNGIARYTSNFTPPTAPFPDI